MSTEIEKTVSFEVNVEDLDADEVIDFVVSNYSVDDIFSEAALADWANRNGWKGPN